MPKLAQLATDGTALFYCPGCDSTHGVPVTGDRKWGWNGSLDAPTFTPSILVTYPANPAAVEEFKEWRTERRCHSFVTMEGFSFLPIALMDWQGRRSLFPIGQRHRRDRD